MTVCTRKHPRGWTCVTAPHVSGAAGEVTWSIENVPCGLVPKWWNIGEFARKYRKDFK